MDAVPTIQEFSVGTQSIASAVLNYQSLDTSIIAQISIETIYAGTEFRGSGGKGGQAVDSLDTIHRNRLFA